MLSPAEALRALDKAMTPGPWSLNLNGSLVCADKMTPWNNRGRLEVERNKQSVATLRNALPDFVNLAECVMAEAAYLRIRAGVPKDVRAGVSSRLDAALSALTEALDA